MKKTLTENEYKALGYLQNKEYTQLYNYMHGAITNDFLNKNLDMLIDEIQEHCKL